MILPPTTMRWLAHNASDLLLAKLERDIARDAEATSRFILHADKQELVAWGWPEDSIAALIKWRIEREEDEAAKRADAEGANALRIDNK